jgi:hypothetical protein
LGSASATAQHMVLNVFWGGQSMPKLWTGGCCSHSNLKCSTEQPAQQQPHQQLL